MIKKDLVIVGGGAAGLAAAVSAFDNGINDILIIERENYLGGILNQCIHNGFGLTSFKQELTGPEYADIFIEQVKERNIEYLLNTEVIKLTRDKHVIYINEKNGLVDVEAKAIVFATGSYERTAGALMLSGDRVSGIMTAGTIQRMTNIQGYVCGKRVVILGSGDIGLIMARRLTLEGAKVICVAELMPYSNGLNRNIVQCLDDFNIPLYLSTTVSKVIGRNRVEKVVLSKVDNNRQIIPNTEQEIECDTLVLSCGLLPQTNLLNNLGIHFGFNKGPVVDENLETEIEGIFTCGNTLHIHDLVDFVSKEGQIAGENAAKYIRNNLRKNKKVFIKTSGLITYIVPNKISIANCKTDIKFRVKKPCKKATLVVVCEGKEIMKKSLLNLLPSIMNEYELDLSKFDNVNDIEIRVDENE